MMTKEEMLQALFTDYTEIKHGFEADLNKLAAGLDGRREAKSSLQQAQEELTATESMVVLSETTPEGKVNGKNAETRAHQTAVLLAELRDNDPEVHDLAEVVELSERAIAMLDVATEVVKARLYSYQALARMNAGLAQALGGSL